MRRSVRTGLSTCRARRGAGTGGIVNLGYWGVPLEEGQDYVASVFVRSPQVGRSARGLRMNAWSNELPRASGIR